MAGQREETLPCTFPSPSQGTTTFADPGESPWLARVLLLPEQFGLASLLTALQLHPPKFSRVLQLSVSAAGAVLLMLPALSSASNSTSSREAQYMMQMIKN